MISTPLGRLRMVQPRLPGGTGGAAAKQFVLGTHRVRPPAETVAALEPLLPGMGITRVADVTGLDIIGIPVVMVVRPNSRSLAVAQGRSLDLDAAKASGIMESVEGYHAERVMAPLRLGSWDDVHRRGRTVGVAGLPQPEHGLFTPDKPLLWAEGVDLFDGQPTWVPYETVHTNYVLPLPTGSGCFACTSNGLASGNHLLEAISHGLAEVIERDSTRLWELKDDRRIVEDRLDLTSVDDLACRSVIDLYDAAGIDVAVWDTTSDLRVPTFLAVIVEQAVSFNPVPATCGFGCHPAREVALLRALTEAAQSRLTIISGSRDDMPRSDYRASQNPDLVQRHRELAAGNGRRSFSDIPTFVGRTIDDDVNWLLERLAEGGLREAVLVDLTIPELNIPVARVVVPGLEGPTEKMPGLRYGPRARELTGTRQ